MKLTNVAGFPVLVSAAPNRGLIAVGLHPGGVLVVDVASRVARDRDRGRMQAALARLFG